MKINAFTLFILCLTHSKNFDDYNVSYIYIYIYIYYVNKKNLRYVIFKINKSKIINILF